MDAQLSIIYIISGFFFLKYIFHLSNIFIEFFSYFLLYLLLDKILSDLDAWKRKRCDFGQVQLRAAHMMLIWESKALPRECTVRTIHTGIDSGCRKIRSKRADWRAKRTACRTRKSERTRERYKIESNLRQKSRRHAESVTLQCAPLWGIFSLFPSPRKIPSSSKENTNAPMQRVAVRSVRLGLACSKNGRVSGWS